MQILSNGDTVAFGKPSREFVQIISPLVGCPFIEPSEALCGLLLVLGAVLFPRVRFRQSFVLSLLFEEKFGFGDN